MRAVARILLLSLIVKASAADDFVIHDDDFEIHADIDAEGPNEGAVNEPHDFADVEGPLPFNTSRRELTHAWFHLFRHPPPPPPVPRPPPPPPSTNGPLRDALSRARPHGRLLDKRAGAGTVHPGLEAARCDFATNDGYNNHQSTCCTPGPNGWIRRYFKQGSTTCDSPPCPLVIYLHGAAQDADYEEHQPDTQLNQRVLAQGRGGAVTVGPMGFGVPTGHGISYRSISMWAQWGGLWRQTRGLSLLPPPRRL